MKVEAHIMAWNEAETIHLTIKHYQKFCNRIVLHDNYSTDNTREIALELGCDVRLFGTKGVLDDREYTKLKNNCWKGSDADWVIVVDADEILDFGEDNYQILARLRFEEYTIIKPQGWQVVSHDVPRGTWLEITNGFRYDQYSKLCCFNPQVLTDINYVHGCHIANPVPNIRIAREGVLFHYRNIGGVDRLIKRHAMYRERMSDWNIRWKAGGHYLYEDQQRIKEWNEAYERSKPYYSHGGGLPSHDTQSQKKD